MKTFVKCTAIAAAALLGTGALFAQDYVVKRIDHPKAQPSFIYVPVDKADGYQQGQTIAFYGRGRSVVVPERVFESTEIRVPVERRRGRSACVPVEEW